MTYLEDIFEAEDALSPDADPTAPTDPTARWRLVVPVKSLARAKSRLGARLSDPDRRALAVAMARDSTHVALVRVLEPSIRDGKLKLKVAEWLEEESRS